MLTNLSLKPKKIIQAIKRDNGNIRSFLTFVATVNKAHAVGNVLRKYFKKMVQAFEIVSGHGHAGFDFKLVYFATTTFKIHPIFNSEQNMQE